MLVHQFINIQVMKQLLIIILFIGFNAFGQTPNSTQKGYYLQMIGDSVVGQNTRPDKAFFDLYNYMKERKIKKGIVISPYWEIDIDYSDAPGPITDTVWLNNGDISIGNQWMGEPVKEMKITGTPIYDNGGSHSVGGGPEVLFDGNLETYRRANNQQGAWTGLSFSQAKINKVRIYPVGLYNGTETFLNGAQIQYSTDGTRWTTLHTISGASVKKWYEYTFQAVTAKFFRIFCPLPYTYGGHIAELEFYKLM